MGNLFNKKESASKSRITEQDKAILQMKQMRDKLKQYQKKIELQIDKERLLAKELVKNGKKEKALLLLKKKKYLEKNLDTTDKQLFNLEEMVSNLEYKQIELKVVEGLKLGNECFKNLNKLLNIDDIERIMDETKESIEYQQEINQLLSGQFTQEDEESMENELDSILGINQEINLPDVPQHSLEIEQQYEKIKQKNRKQAELAD